jgi:hypothetical protein
MLEEGGNRTRGLADHRACIDYRECFPMLRTQYTIPRGLRRFERENMIHRTEYLRHAKRFGQGGVGT